MAFQDNSGGIILDATLTDIGRKYMTQGKFKVVKFSLGDDEINYNFVSGNVNTEDHKIPAAKTPSIMEAYGGTGANITHGLLSFERIDILYIPKFKLNNKIDSGVTKHSDGFIYMSINSETTRKLKAEFANDSKKIIEQNTYNKNKIFIESGIEMPGGAYFADVQATEKNKKMYILNTGLYDKYCTLYSDNRIIDSILVTPAMSKFENSRSDQLTAEWHTLKEQVSVTLPSIDENFNVWRIQTVDNQVTFQPGAAATGEAYSMFSGPRATIFGFNVVLKPEMISAPNGTSDARYSLLGKTNNDLFGSGNLYDFIDTTIYIQGMSSNSRIQIPIRIVRYAGT